MNDITILGKIDPKLYYISVTSGNVVGSLLNKFFEQIFAITVKLGYNELGYNEHPVITNKVISLGWF